MKVQVAKPKAGKLANSAMAHAKEAVALFETELESLQRLRGSFEAEYPDAVQALQNIKLQEDAVVDSIARAKPLVAKAGVTVGDFKCQKKFSKAHYDPDIVTKIVSEADNAGEVFEMFVAAGLIKKLDIDKDSTVAYFAQNPELAEAFVDAWKDKTEMTPSITVPKL